MNNFNTFIRSMKMMGDRLYLYLGTILVMSITFSMFTVMSSLLMKCVVDISQTGRYEELAYKIATIVITGIISLLIYRVATIRYNVEAKRVFGSLSEKVLETEMSLPYEYYEKHHSGEIVSKISYDLTRMGDIYGSRLRRVVMPCIQVIVFLVPMFFMCWELTLCLIAVNGLMMAIQLKLLNPIHRVSKEMSAVNSSMASNMSDMLQGMEQVRMYQGGTKTIRQYKEQNKKYALCSYKKNRYAACLESSGKGFDLLCSLVFLVLGVFFVSRGYTTLGSLAAIYTMYGSFSFQFLEMGKYIPELVGCVANAKNVFDFLDEAKEPQNWYNAGTLSEKENKTEKDNDLAIDIEKISFSYDREIRVINDFSLKVKKGECVAITGESGCGKTTLSKLLLGLYKLESGDMIINQHNIKEVPLTQIRKQIAYVPQEPYLFGTTIKENIAMGRKDADEESIIEAARQANAHEFIESFPDGYNTFVGERGNNLSGGQRQRIAIARAILKDAPILLLDEATSALDNESEQMINDALKGLRHKKTIVMIAHRPSTIELADREYRMH